MKHVKIMSDLSADTMRVIDMTTGAEIKKIFNIEIQMKVRESNEAIISVYVDKIDIEAMAEEKHYCPHCRQQVSEEHCDGIITTNI